MGTSAAQYCNSARRRRLSTVLALWAAAFTAFLGLTLVESTLGHVLAHARVPRVPPVALAAVRKPIMGAARCKPTASTHVMVTASSDPATVAPPLSAAGAAARPRFRACSR